MSLDELKTTYKNTNKDFKSKEEIEAMTRIRKHPVLKGIIRQLIIETIPWTLFLIFYYDFFDGHLKPVFWNILLVSSVIFLLVHNLLGFAAAKNLIAGNDIKQSLKNYLQKIKRYSVISITSRALAILSLMLFFISTVNFNNDKYWVVGAVILIIVFQIFMLSRIWFGRINKIQNVVESFNQI